jgi:hypothetical protein
MPLVHFDASTFGAHYNRSPFLVRHELANHPLMQLSKLTELALRMDRKDVLHRIGHVPVNTDFDRAHLNHALDDSLENAIAHIGGAGVAITINTPERDPEYRGLIESILEEIRAYSEPIDPGMNWSAAYIFIAAPGSLTPYHMDREMNFLLHVQGRKTVHLWDPKDSDVMTEIEVDRLFGEYVRPPYKAPLAGKARIFTLEPGTGLHHPFIAPHLVESGSEVAVSLANTRFRSDFRFAQDQSPSAAFRYFASSSRCVAVDGLIEDGRLPAHDIRCTTVAALGRRRSFARVKSMSVTLRDYRLRAALSNLLASHRAIIPSSIVIG